ncbi:ATP-binding protein [Paenibacillus sp. HJGM_3]|uniref:ATP-binding protein n=1 Tax=Paenibacillus sp. HJGM_3 TaxID=3379816 RepID=UPI00385DC9B5
MRARKKGLASRVSVLIFTVMALFAVVVAAFGSYMAQLISTTRGQMEVEVQDQMKIERLHSQSQSLVSSVRGYLAYGRDEFLNEFESNRSAFSNELVQLKDRMYRAGTTENEKLKLLDQIGALWEEYVKLTGQSVELKQSDDQDRFVLFSRSMTDIVDLINSKFGEIAALQDAKVAKLIETDRRETNLLLYIPVFVVIGSAIAGWLLVRYLRSHVIAPLIVVEQAVDQIAGGAYVELELPGRMDEIGRLTHGINGMSSDLQARHSQAEQAQLALTEQRDLLEAQNEEITAQQLEQEAMLIKLTERERELELISSYQEKLSGYNDMHLFLERTVSAMLQALGMDAAVLIVPNAHTGAYDVVHAHGYPPRYLPASFSELFGVSRQLLTEKKSVVRTRMLNGAEKGLHLGYDRALDVYYPLLDENAELVGLLLLTAYGESRLTEVKERLIHGLLRQFSLAYMAQTVNEDRRKQAELLEELNDELSQEKESLQEQRDFVRRIVESVHEGMVMCDSDGRIKFVNGWMNRTFGIEESQALSVDRIFDVLQPRLDAKSKSLRELAGHVLAGELVQLQERFSIVQADGREAHYELYVNAILDPSESGKSYLLVFRDRTEEEKADEMKNEFISIVSHELRTPLASILGFMEIMLHRDIAKEKQQKYMETIYKEAIRLSSLINDFLDLQRIESGKQSYQMIPLDVAAIAREVADQWQGKQEHRLVLTVPEDAKAIVLADPDRMAQVFHNLISNAIKYSPAANEVDIRVIAEPKRIVIEIQDYGLGIPEDAKGKLFDKFYRVDNSDRRQIGGTGLGLSIVKEIVEAHGGRLTFDSVLGRGSTFRITYDAYVPVDVSGKIVIVEDDDNLAKLMALSFEKLQLPSLQLKTAEAAILALQASLGKPLLCIVDIQLEGRQTGWDFVAELLRWPEQERTPIIVSTVLEQPSHFRETETEKFLRKPFSVERLLELAEQLIGKSQEPAPVVFPMQNEEKLVSSLEKKGIRVKAVKVKQDIIEVEVKSDE